VPWAPSYADIGMRQAGGISPDPPSRMLADADSIDDLELLRHGGMGRLFGGIRAPRSGRAGAGRRTSPAHPPVPTIATPKSAISNHHRWIRVQEIA
jgi:hypothetical protein